jgi:integrase
VKERISTETIEALKPGQFIVDSEVKGFTARCLPSGVISYGFRYRTSKGRPMLRLGLHGSITTAEARRLAKKYAGQVAERRDPATELRIERAVATNTVNAVLDNYMKRDVEARGLRSAAAIKSAFDRLVRPRLGSQSIYELKKSDIAKLLDTVADDSGPVMADRVLAYLRAAFRWQADRDDDFRPPLVKARTKPSERKRQRVLDDQEIRDLWRALDLLGEDAPTCYPAFVRALLLSGQRRTNVSHMTRDEISNNNWIIPGARTKHKKDHLVPITPALQKLFGNRPGFVFSSNGGDVPFSGYSKAKTALDRKIKELRKAAGRKPMPHWTLHDLRRTARSIMSRYTTADHAERAIGHVVGGVRGVYDVHEYADEKRAALKALAKHIDDIVSA